MATMIKIPYEKMVCDSDYGDGGVYFYDDYFEWINRDTGKGFRIHYIDIQDISVVLSSKKRVTILTKGGATRNLYLYKSDELLKLLNDAIERVNGKPQEDKVENVSSKENVEDDISKLERLAKLHESGALTDEEFKVAKQKILGMDK